MKDTSHHDDKLARMIVVTVYPHYVTNNEKKGWMKAQLHQVITWLAGFTDTQVAKMIKDE